MLTLALVAALSWSVSRPKLIEKGNWQPLFERDKIQVYAMEIPGSPYLGMKFITSVDAPLARVITVLEDSESHHLWQSNLMQKRVLKRSKHPYGRDVYVEYAAPWPVANREFIFRMQLTLRPTKAQVLYQAVSIENSDLKPKPGNIRGTLLYSESLLSSIDQGRRTSIVMETFADPAGNLPTWLVHWGQKNLSYKTMIDFKNYTLGSPTISKKVLDLLKEFTTGYR